MCLWQSRRNRGTHVTVFSTGTSMCSLDDLIMFTDVGKQCAELWKGMV